MTVTADDPLARAAFIAAREAGLVPKSYGWTSDEHLPRTLTEHGRGQWAAVARGVASLIAEADAEIDRVLPSKYHKES